MATAIAYGSLTLTDLTDLGEFSVMPMSNLPLTVIYDPDQHVYTPTWNDSNLRVTPAVYYAGQPVALGSSGLSVTWQRQEGVSGYTALTTGESVVDDGVLSVTQNKFTPSSTMITYIVTATYQEPTAQITLTAQGQITFSLVKNSSGAKTCFINGDSIFKYNTSQELVGASTITLTGSVSNVTISEWQYQNSSGNWVKYPGSGTGTTLTVRATDETFINSDNKCFIRLTTSDPSVYDLHTIVKLRDGAAGSKTVSAVLTNDDQMVPFDSEGTGNFSAATSRIIIYEGGTDVTDTWTISVSFSGCVGTTSTTTVANDTVSVTRFDGGANNGNVTFTCTKQNYDALTKTFSLVKIESGADGLSPTIYSLDADTLAINKDISDPPIFTPASVTFRAYAQTGEVKDEYDGMFRIFENISYAEYLVASPKPTPKASSSSAEPSKTYTPSSSATSILCILYAGGAFDNVLDTQQVVITSDGATGEEGPQGPDGASAINIVLGNYADVLTCTNGNTIIGSGSPAQQSILIPFAAYEGTTRIPCTVTAPALLGVSATTSAATATTDGYVRWNLPTGTSVPTADGTVSLTFVATASTGQVVIIENYTWSRNSAAANAVFLQIYASGGYDTITDDNAQVTMQGQLTDGGLDVTNTGNITWTWSKWNPTTSQYTTVPDANLSSLTVTNTDVQSYASYRLQADYGTGHFYAYFSVYDKHDPIQVSVLSSVGTQLVNGVGYGAIYAKVTRNGSEIDAIRSETFSTTPPSGAAKDDLYYHIDKTNKTVTLKKYSGSQWNNETEGYTGSYSWSWRDKDGNGVTTMNGNALPTQGKVIYIDGDMIDTKIIADVTVEI